MTRGSARLNLWRDPSSPRRAHRVAFLRLLVIIGMCIALIVIVFILSPRRAPNITRNIAGNWRLTFSANFAGTALDKSLWKTCYDNSCRIATNPEFEWYVPKGVSLDRGRLVLTARRQPTHGEQYSSGMVQSNGRFDFRYGYVEIRARIPSGRGTWPALWLLPENHRWPPEIDIMEFWGSSPGQIEQSVFLPSNRLGIHHNVSMPRATVGFHTFGVNWEPGVISWYVDGRLTFRLYISISTPMYPILNLAVSAPPNARNAQSFPARFEIQYVRVFQHPGIGSRLCKTSCG